MFLGHFAFGLAAQPAAPRAPLPALLLAPMLLDATQVAPVREFLLA